MCFYNWEQLRDLSGPGSLDRSHFIANCREADGDLEIAEAAADGLQKEREASFAFVYLGYTDIAGHNFGWMSDQYLEAIGSADRALGEVVSVLDGARTATIVTSDHGGH